MRKLIRVTFALIVVLAVLGVLAVVHLNTAVRHSVQAAGSYALGVDATVRDTRIGIVRGSSSLRGIALANPEGYRTPHLMTIDECSLEASYDDLRDKTVRLPVMRLDGLNMHFEKRRGKSNVNVVIENLQRFESIEPGMLRELGPRFIVDEIIITNVLLQTEILPWGGELSRVEMPIKRIRLTGVGSDAEDGLLMSQLTAAIFKSLLAAIIYNGVKLPADLVADIGSALAVLKPLGDFGVEVITVTGEIVWAVIEGVGLVLEGVGEGVGELLGGNK